ncbi:MAG: cupin domain-containing protein [Chloroflexota bacterium]|nr:cupin domain-containing protein [Chloroflexota bacterium]
MINAETSLTGNSARFTAPGAAVPGWTGDATVICKASGATTGGAFALFELYSAPGSGAPVHVHQYEDEALYVLDGEYEVTDADAGTRVVAGPGACVVLPRGTRHSFRNIAHESARLLALVTPAGLEGFFEEIAANPADGLAIAQKYGLEFFG